MAFDTWLPSHINMAENKINHDRYKNHPHQLLSSSSILLRLDYYIFMGMGS